MSFEYIYIYQRGLTLEEFMEKLNLYGEEGYHLVQQDTYGVFLLERQVYPAMSEMTIVTKKPLIPDTLYLSLMALFTVILIIAVTARVYHWI